VKEEKINKPTAIAEKWSSLGSKVSYAAHPKLIPVTTMNRAQI
jgi:hypothetical protein